MHVVLNPFKHYFKYLFESSIRSESNDSKWLTPHIPELEAYHWIQFSVMPNTHTHTHTHTYMHIYIVSPIITVVVSSILT